MIRDIRPEQFEGLDLQPAATIAVSPARFRELGYNFIHGVDDLDGYEFAAFEIDGNGVIGLMHYDNSADPNTTLLVDSGIRSDQQFLQTIEAVAKAFALPVSLFHWVTDGHPASLSQNAAE